MRCRECGFGYNLAPGEIAERSRSGVGAVRAAIAGVPEASRHRRPSPGVWSVNAYVAHLADAAGVIRDRVRAIMELDRPALPYHDQDRAVEEGNADEQSADVSLRRLEDAVAGFQRLIMPLAPEQWDRVGVHERAGEVTLREIAHDIPHELEHHAMDIRRVGAFVSGDGAER